MATDEKEPWEDDGESPRKGIPLPVIKLIFGIVSVVLITEFINHSGNLNDLLYGIGISIVVFMAERLMIRAIRNTEFSGSPAFLSALPAIVMAIAVVVAALTYGITGNGVVTFGTLIFPSVLTLMNWMMS